ncbi:MAG: hypothetical protein HRU00_17230 [Myxococcales bacterium]|nr:hypothetical protein [Myxococcales bacterium]
MQNVTNLSEIFSKHVGVPIEDVPEEFRDHREMSTAASRIASGQPIEEGATKMGTLVGKFAKSVGAVCLYQLTPCVAVRHRDGTQDVFWDGLFCMKDGSVVPGPSHGDLTRDDTASELRRKVREGLRLFRTVGEQPAQGSEWTHSDGETYTVIGPCTIECRDNPIDGCPGVVYSGPSGIHCRPLSEFTDGTFSAATKSTEPTDGDDAGWAGAAS